MNPISQTPERTAIIKPCCIGDCIMALPAIDALVVAWPETVLDVFVGNHSRAAFEFRSMLTVRPAPNALNLRKAVSLAARLRGGRYDCVINLDRSRWLRLATRLAKSPRSARARKMSPELRHESEVYLDVVRELGIPTPIAFPVIEPRQDAVHRATEMLAGVPETFAVLHVGGAQNPGIAMPSKRWPADRCVTLIQKLERDGIAVTLSGSDQDLDVVRQVAGRAGLDESRILAGKADLATLAAILQRAALYVGPDTGVSHLAAAVGSPTIAIFGPTNPRRYRPLGPNVRVVAPPESWQIPDRDLRQTPARPDAVSTNSVTVDAVMSAARDLLAHHHGPWRCSG